MEQRKSKNTMTLARYLIQMVDKEAYRGGTMLGVKHPKVDEKMLRAVGGLERLKCQAKELEKEGMIRVDWTDIGRDLEKIHFSVEHVQKLCEREGMEDPRKQQLRWIKQMKEEQKDVEGSFLIPYYDEIIERLEKGKKVANPDIEDQPFFECLNEIVHLDQAIWRRVFSSYVFGKSKTFENDYEAKVVGVLKKYSPYFKDGMEDHEILEAHGIKTYSQTLEVKGSLQYELENIDGTKILMDLSTHVYGEILNEQTLEHANPVGLRGVQRIIMIENKANYEDMAYCDDTLYLYCHGFVSPKEKIFLQKIADLIHGVTVLHWGDMDLGGIRIFLYNKKEIFPELKPYRMDGETFLKAVENNAGILLESGKRKQLEKLDAEDLEELKQVILETGLEIEQESLLALEKSKKEMNPLS